MRQLVLPTLLALVVAASAANSGFQTVVGGSVVDGVSGQPVREARVSVAPLVGSVTVPPVLTDALGRFVFEGLPSGTYTIQAVKAGYSQGVIRQERPGGMGGWLDLREGGRLQPSVIRIWKLAGFAGMVRNETNEPEPGAVVHAMQTTRIGSGFQLATVRTARTDDQGMFRFVDLLAGTYVPAVASRRGEHPYPVVFYPQASSSRTAQSLELAPGELREGIDFARQSLPAVRVTGRVVVRGGNPGGVPLRLVSDEYGALHSALDVLTTTSRPTGEFEFSRVGPGSYAIETIVLPTWPPNEPGFKGYDRFGLPPEDVVLAPTPRGSGGWARFPVVVGDDSIEGLEITLHEGFRIAGRVVFEGTSAKPSSSVFPTRAVLVRPLEPRTVDVPLTRIEPDGRFQTVPLVPGRYMVGMRQTFPGWDIRSVKISGAEVAGRSFHLADNVLDVVVTLTDRPTEISGVVRGVDGWPDMDATVLLFPADTSLWMDSGSGLPGRMMGSRPLGGGRYAYRVFPGSYYVVAVAGSLPRLWQDPGFLGSIRPRAVTVDVAAGQRAVQDLRVVTLR